MRKLLLPLAALALVSLSAATASATANYVYHEQTANFVAQPTCPSGGTDTACGRYVENTDRNTSTPGYQIYTPETFSLHFKVEFQNFTNAARVFYTTDGTTPTANDNCVTSPFVQCNPTATGTTQTINVASGPAACTYQDQNSGCQIVDVLAAQIPPQPAGTTVKYIIAAWHTGGGEVVYANSAGPNCGDGVTTCGFYCHSGNNGGTSGCATVFSYGVLALPPTPLIISEFRLRGPGTGAAGSGANDEFVEIYNNSDSPVTVQAYDGSGGFAVAASDGVPRFTIPNGTPIPARGHFLGVNSAGYSLGSYPASTTATASGGGDATEAPAPDAAPLTVSRSPKGKGARALVSHGAKQPKDGGLVVSVTRAQNDTVPGPSATATGDATYTTDIADNAGIALFNTADQTKFSTTTRLDAVGSTSEANTLYREGSGYPALGGAGYLSGLDYSFFRDQCGKGGSITTLGACTRSTPQDTGANEADFIFVDTSGAPNVGAGQRLGAPGPENSTSPIQRNGGMPGSRIFPCLASSASPNRERNFSSDPMNNSQFGTLSIRIRVTNNTGVPVTRLRFRIIDVTTYPAPTTYADLRARSSTAVTVLSDPCTGLPRTIQGTTLEQPPAQPFGGGFNSTLSAGTITMTSALPAEDNPATPLVVENAYDFQLLFGVQQLGRFKVYVNVEVLP